MVALAWFVILLFLLFGVGPVIAILCTRDAFITYREAVGLGFVIMCLIVAAIGVVALIHWAFGVVAS